MRNFLINVREMRGSDIKVRIIIRFEKLEALIFSKIDNMVMV